MAYVKQEVKAGDIMDPNWGNHIQTQYEEALPKHGSDANAQYYRWDSGLQIVTGRSNPKIVVQNEIYLDTITFPVPFAFVNDLIITTSRVNASYADDWSPEQVYDKTVTNFKIACRHLASSSRNYIFDYVAIGKWK